MSAKKKILIVDDSEMNRALLEDMLADDYDIVEAENGMEALAYLHEHELEICLMLLDIVMPVMDGFETLAMMNKNGIIKHIPVIMISAETAFTYIDRAYGLGAVDFISRPFDEQRYTCGKAERAFHKAVCGNIRERKRQPSYDTNSFSYSRIP